MLHLRGSDCGISLRSTWYEKMDNFLIYLGFTKSKVGPNLYLKFECGILVYVDDLTGKDELIVDAKRKY